MALIYAVEDDKNILEIEMFALKNSGYQVEGFECARDFYKKLEEKQPDLALLDIMLPDEDGLEIVAKLRRRPETKKLPIIMHRDAPFLVVITDVPFIFRICPAAPYFSICPIHSHLTYLFFLSRFSVHTQQTSSPSDSLSSSCNKGMSFLNYMADPISGIADCRIPSWIPVHMMGAM